MDADDCIYEDDSVAEESMGTGTAGFWMSVVLFILVIGIYILFFRNLHQKREHGQPWNLMSIGNAQTVAPNGHDIVISQGPALAISSPQDSEMVGSIFKVVNSSAVPMVITPGQGTTFVEPVSLVTVPGFG